MTQKEILQIEKTIKLKIIDKQKWEAYKIVNGSRGKELFNYIERCGKCMQYLMETKKQDIKSSFNEAMISCNFEGFSKKTRDYASKILIDCWAYGNRISKYFNGASK